MRRALCVLLLLVAGLVIAGPAYGCGILETNCNVTETGIELLGQQELRHLGAEQHQQVQQKVPHYEYKTLDACLRGGSLTQQEGQTNQIKQICPGLDGPRVDILRRLVDVDGSVLKDWTRVGSTCLPNEVPGAAKRPTMAMVVEAFHHTPWAKASIGFQPKGFLTLVNLPSFYQVTWAAAGFGPGEVDTVNPATMFGHRFAIRPTLVSFTYHFGDGTTLGPTTSPGGVYPNGDIRHTYARPGTYQVFVTVVWGADFQVDGGPWVRLPATASVDQPAASVTVKTAHNRLVTG